MLTSALPSSNCSDFEDLVPRVFIFIQNGGERRPCLIAGRVSPTWPKIACCFEITWSTDCQGLLSLPFYRCYPAANLGTVRYLWPPLPVFNVVSSAKLLKCGEMWLYCIVLCCVVSCRVVSYRIVSYRIVLYCIVLYFIVLYCMVLYCMAWHCKAWYSIVRYR